MARPKNTHATISVEFTATPKLAQYLDELKQQEGYGNSRGEIARNFVWKEVNRLIETRVLKTR